MQIIKDLRHDKLIKRSLESHNFVWFGDVDQHSDEHDVILGLTSSVTHRDSHFAIGSHNGRDIRFVRRQEGSDTWYILAMSINSQAPAFVISYAHDGGLHTHTRTHFMPLNDYTPEFSSRYRIEAVSSDFHILEESYLSVAVVRELAVHLWPLQVQFDGHTLYLYSSQFDEHTLQGMIRSAAWIADALEK